MATITTAAELRTLEADDLTEKLRESKEELFNLRFQAATGQLDNHGRLRSVRRDIARIYTVVRERELGIVEGTESGIVEGTESATEDTAANSESEDA